jgi:putative membrane protein
MTHQKYLLTLSIVFLLAFVALGIEPHHRSDWLLENVLVVIFAAIMLFSYRYFPLSRLSYTLIFLFMLLHQVGAHYTYSDVPYDEFFVTYLGFSLNDLLGWERNNFDRVVHFLYGLLLAYPIKEVYCRIARAEGFWGYFFPLELTMASSMIYELIEWGAAGVFGGDLGMAYLGTQGDIWDAHKDMALASLGALIAMLITMAINMRIQPDFWDEWRSSLSIKSNVPLGEDEISRLMHRNGKRRR